MIETVLVESDGYSSDNSMKNSNTLYLDCIPFPDFDNFLLISEKAVDLFDVLKRKFTRLYEMDPYETDKKSAIIKWKVDGNEFFLLISGVIKPSGRGILVKGTRNSCKSIALRQITREIVLTNKYVVVVADDGDLIRFNRDSLDANSICACSPGATFGVVAWEIDFDTIKLAFDHINNELYYSYHRDSDRNVFMVSLDSMLEEPLTGMMTNYEERKMYVVYVSSHPKGGWILCTIDRLGQKESSNVISYWRSNRLVWKYILGRHTKRESLFQIQTVNESIYSIIMTRDSDCELNEHCPETGNVIQNLITGRHLHTIGNIGITPHGISIFKTISRQSSGDIGDILGDIGISDGFTFSIEKYRIQSKRGKNLFNLAPFSRDIHFHWENVI